MAESCTSCRRPKATTSCEICAELVCKDCSHFLDAETFSFQPVVPADLKHTHYCANCYSAKVEPALAAYNEVMERAQGVFVFFTTQKKYFKLLSRSRELLEVKECADRDEAILRLAFQAAEKGFNAVIEVEATSKKERNAGHQKYSWKCKGYPAQVDGAVVDSY